MKKWVRLTGDAYVTKDVMILKTPGTNKVPVMLADMDLHVEVANGSFIEEDCICNSTFMLDIIHEVGNNIENAFIWLPQETTSIHLCMDNTGGHGTNAGREEYIIILQDEFNVIVLWQIAHSLETNMLNLGA
jgi:hypothetical protein